MLSKKWHFPQAACHHTAELCQHHYIAHAEHPLMAITVHEGKPLLTLATAQTRWGMHHPSTTAWGGCSAALGPRGGHSFKGCSTLQNKRLSMAWGQGTYCSRYFLVVKTLIWSLKVQVEILSQSELETISRVFRNWKSQTIGKRGLLLSLASAATVQRVLWQPFILPTGQDTSFLLC